MSGWTKRLHQIDFFRALPLELSQPSGLGSCVSVLSVAVMFLLFATQTTRFNTVHFDNSMVLDMPTDSTVMMYINMTMHNLPCSVASLDVDDAMSTHLVNVHGPLHKTRISYNSSTDVTHVLDPEQDAEHQIGEGCHLYGAVPIKLCPGAVHISAHAHPDLVAKVVQPNYQGQLNISHTIHSLTFGRLPHLNVMTDMRMYNALQNTSHYLSTLDDQNRAQFVHEYILNVVPTQWVALNGETQRSYQYTTSSNQVEFYNPMFMSAVYFRLNFSPITARITETAITWSEYMTALCAIIGGVFTVSGMLHGVIKSMHVQVKQLLQKLE